ncbi:MAG: MGMT family protein, partial [Verrucomicrobiia bacterium]
MVVAIRGTAFQHDVWRVLLTIPRGSIMTYREVATLLGKPKAARAVGGACAANPVAILIPCHRVVPRGGSLGGYRWGASLKRRLLE